MKESYLSVPKWDEFQHYKDRAPPWIKLHNSIMENYQFECLPDASKAHLFCIWLLASRTNNKIKNDPQWIARRIGANSKVNIDILVENGFLVINQELQSVEQNASTMLAECYREESRGEERESRGEQNIYVKDVFDFWINAMGKTGKTALSEERKKPIKARLDEGYSVEEIKQAILNCSKSEYHMTNGYNDLTLICRNASKLESFRDMSALPKTKNIDGQPIGKKGSIFDLSEQNYQTGDL